MNYHEIIKPNHSIRDIHNLLEKFQPHISFTNEEEHKGRRILTEFGVPEAAKFVCLIARDSAYLERHKEIHLSSSSL